MHRDELRRIQRVKVCCRVDVRDRFGVWTAVTEDVSPRGCRLVTAKLPRIGSALELRLSSDLFSEVLEMTGHAAWVSDLRVGVDFVAGSSRIGRLSPAEWVERLVEQGKVLGPEPVGNAGPRLAPALRRTSSAARASGPPRAQAREEDGEQQVLGFPGQR